MSDALEILPNVLSPVEFERASYGHVVPARIEWREVLRAGYWQNVAHKLRPGDRIEVMTADRQVCFEGYVLEVNHRISPPHLVVSWRPIYPLDLDLPAPLRRNNLRFSVRAEAGSQRHFEIFDAQIGAVARAHLSRDEALDHAALLELAAHEAAGRETTAAPPRRAVRG